jgi:hypothetical protein
MASSVPVIKQIALVSLVPQLLLIAVFIGAAYLAGFEQFVVVGTGAYLIVSLSLRRFIPRDHRAGIVRVRREEYSEALPYFERSYDFFTRHRWIDDWRFITLASSSRISYREAALLNVAYCYAQTGNGEKAWEYYQRVKQEFPGSRIAEAALRMLEAAKGIAEPDGVSNNSSSSGGR